MTARPHPPVTALFLDIGGVLLTNGWDREARDRAAVHFGIDKEEMDERHHLTFDTYEEGKMSIDEYLKRTVFHRPRAFTPRKFKDFIFGQSQPYPRMIGLMSALKARHRLKVAAISNEGKELTVYRIRTFRLGELIQFFISSCFVHFRKPDEDIYRIALDIAQVRPEEALYIDDRPLFIEVARSLGIFGVIHTGYESTKAALAGRGLS
jgi:putative hydrolase of the HAD superfamily